MMPQNSSQYESCEHRHLALIVLLPSPRRVQTPQWRSSTIEVGHLIYYSQFCKIALYIVASSQD